MELVDLKEHNYVDNPGEKKMITPRIPNDLHRLLAEEAKELGVSQNDLYIARLSSATVGTKVPIKQ